MAQPEEIPLVQVGIAHAELELTSSTIHTSNTTSSTELKSLAPFEPPTKFGEAVVLLKNLGKEYSLPGREEVFILHKSRFIMINVSF